MLDSFTKCCVYPINNRILDNKKASQCEISLHRKHPLRQDSCQNSGSCPKCRVNYLRKREVTKIYCR